MLQTLSVSPGVTFHSYPENASVDDIQGALLGLIVTCANTSKYAELVVFASEERWQALMIRVQRALFEDSQDFLPVDVKENRIRYTHARGMEGVKPRQIHIYGNQRAAELRGMCGDACIALCREQGGTPPIYFPSRQVLYDVILPWRQFRQDTAQEAPLYLLLPKDRADMAKTRGQLRAEAQPTLLVNEYLWDRSPLAREMLQREQEEALNRIEIQRIMAEDAEQQSKVPKPDGRAASYTPRVGTADGDKEAPAVPYEPSDIADIARIIRPAKAKMRIGEKEDDKAEAELLAAIAKQERDARIDSLHGAVRAMLEGEEEEEMR